jgi:hypothetical protein
MTFQGHGWGPPSMQGSIHVGELPGRKQLCLYEEEGSIIRVLAFFKTPEQAQKTLDYLDALAAI